MKKPSSYMKSEAGSGGGYLLLWLFGVPAPILLLIFLLRGCQ
jgi:hypothetical protein